MYNGEANIFQENLDNFLSLAKRLKILGLLQNDQGDPHEDFTPDQVTKTDQEETAGNFFVENLTMEKVEEDKTLENMLRPI